MVYVIEKFQQDQYDRVVYDIDVRFVDDVNGFLKDSGGNYSNVFYTNYDNETSNNMKNVVSDETFMYSLVRSELDLETLKIEAERYLNEHKFVDGLNKMVQNKLIELYKGE